MNNYMLPSDDDFVEHVARAIARDRLYRDASATVQDMIGVPIENVESLEGTFNRVFDALWAGDGEVDRRNKNEYRADARAAIAAINLKILTSTG